MKYIVLVESDEDKLTDIVESYILNGWMPQGGVAITSHYNSYREEETLTFAQAMVKNN